MRTWRQAAPRRPRFSRALAAVTLWAAAWLAMPPAARAAPPSVVLITVDGVRPEEIFRGLDPRLDPRLDPGEGEGARALVPRLLAAASTGGFLTGDAGAGGRFAVQNLALCSLPGYQAILSGEDLGCWDNGCGRIGVETVLERARRELGLPARDVAVFAGWPEIALAVERTEGQLTVNVGYQPFAPSWAAPDAATEALNRAQAEDRPPWGHRRDRYTWALAMRYLERFRPRVLYIALGDPDEWAHLGDYPAYAQSVRDLDERLADLRARLQAMGEHGAATSVLVTTDHGRGTGEDWRHHGFWYRGSGRAWLFASTPATRLGPGRPAGGRLGHLNVRPTVEALLGLAPCARCREAIAEVLPADLPARPAPADWPGSAGP